METYHCNFKALSQDIICGSIPPVANGEWIQELKENNISVCDDSNGPIEILIGADIAGKLMTGGFKLLTSGLAAIETKLGWTLFGKNGMREISDNSALLVTSMLNKEILISDLWSLDSLGILDPSEKKSKLELQEEARDHFLSTVKVNEEGRFQVSLPWLDNHLPLKDNYDLAVKRLASTVKRLKAEKLKLYDAYGEVFSEWEQEGIIEEVPKSEIDVTCHYLPHRHVVKENSTTRIRPVFDASAKQKGSPSLNDCLEKGQNLIELIPSILHRFRMNRIGVSADIRKAFLQISLNPKDKDYLRFLWYRTDGKLKYYRHCRVVFGVTSSPFLLVSVIHHLLESTLKQLNGNPKWWEGPKWLYLSPEKWPKEDFSADEEEIALEKKKRIISSLINLNASEIVATRFSSYRKTIRLVAWMCRFVYNCKHQNKKKDELTVSELNEAEREIS
ncbi:uncharacterized protein LOC118201973 [Stegodyphus dumicola]|uniref:uncharacterized protein LOC118201973 n=1 Tax=Stegodyphus dumicola TaxID=202533 RepID=UPI0015AE5EC2|nr:uncharacterized protein LOC118201973 [Stegodyphus dumicola]